jgi:diguanylate cyclase (GGDEF)-like protein
VKTLLVEDSAETRMVLEAVLQARGWSVDSFETAEEAWAACQERAYDLAVLDWMLPGQDGLELCEQIRTLEWGDRVIVLVVTSRSRIFDLQIVLQAGADDYVSKPLDPDLLDVRLTIAERGVQLLGQRKRTEEAKARALQRLQILHDIDRSILASRSSAEIAASALERLLNLTALENVHVVEFDFENQEAQVVASTSREGSSVQVGTRMPLDGFQIAALRRGEMALSGAAAMDAPSAATHRPAPCRSSACFPLIVGGELIGSLNLGTADSGPLDDEQALIAREVATSLAVGIQSSRLTAELQRLATTDELTGTHNRRKLFDIGAREVLRSHRFGRPLSAIMLDIDHFKRINDSHGHATGDRVLLCVALRCQQAIREIDILGRYGGEEFAILLPETDSEHAMEVAERLRSDLEALALPTEDGTLSLTVSIGVAQLGNGADDLPALLDRADAAMYDAKRAGRNAVKIAPS